MILKIVSREGQKWPKSSQNIQTKNGVGHFLCPPKSPIFPHIFSLKYSIPNGKLKGITVTPDPSAANYLRVARSRFAVYGNMVVADIAIDVLQDIGTNNNTKIFTVENVSIKYEYDFQAIVTDSANKFAATCGLIYKPDGCYLDNNPALYYGQKISAIIVIPDIYLN